MLLPEASEFDDYPSTPVIAKDDFLGKEFEPCQLAVSDEKPQLCEICGKTFRIKAALSRHLKAMKTIC